jgi:hypothetical protein
MGTIARKPATYTVSPTTLTVPGIEGERVPTQARYWKSQ